MKEDKEGWWDMPPLKQWKCIKCGETSDVELWEEVECYCEDCGSHDGRECPECGEWYDHVWGFVHLAEGQPREGL